jgi:hypothetical protein
MQRECAAAANQVDGSFEREASSPVFARLRSIAAGRSASCCAAAGDPGKKQIYEGLLAKFKQCARRAALSFFLKVKRGVLLTHLPPTISHSVT